MACSNCRGSRENSLTHPTKALDSLVNEQIRPNAERLRDIVLELIRTEVDDQELWVCAFSIAAQWLFYFHSGRFRAFAA